MRTQITKFKYLKASPNNIVWTSHVGQTVKDDLDIDQ